MTFFIFASSGIKPSVISYDTMNTQQDPGFVLGIDYGTDSCRAVVIDAANGAEIATTR